MEIAWMATRQLHVSQNGDIVSVMHVFESTLPRRARQARFSPIFPHTPPPSFPNFCPCVGGLLLFENNTYTKGAP